MASNNEYKRYFIILQEDDKGYEISSGKTPTGYVKIEVKNNKVKLNAFIQNVKLDDRIEYRLLLIASVRKLAVDIGKIVIDGSGRGELSYELESDNVMKSGLNIADFNVAAVTAGASAPLSGYTGRDKQEWKGKYEVLNRPKPTEEVRKEKKPPVEEIMPPEPPAPILPPEIEVPPVPEAPPMPEMPPEPVIPPPPPEPVIPPEPVKPPVPEEMPPIIIVAPKPEPEITQIIENKVEIEVLIPKCPPMAPMEEPCEFEEEEEKKKKHECDDIKEFYCEDEDEESDSESDSDEHEHKHEHKHEREPEPEHDEDHKHYHEEYPNHASAAYYGGNMYRRLKKVLRRLRRYEPFEDEKGCDWFRVGSDIYELNQVAVPYMGHMLPLGYPFMSEGCSMLLDRKDYIIGIKYEEKDEDDRYIKHVFFGIPALYSKKNEHYYKSRGYSQFRPHKSKGYGYFIMCLDIEKGTLCHMD
ncbi:MAG: hypothetical protein ACM3ZR_01880 [Pseudomonadota bacterium]